MRKFDGQRAPACHRATAFDRTAPCTAGDKQVRQVGFDQDSNPAVSPRGFRTPQRKFDRWHRSRPDWIFSSIYNHQQMLDFHPHNHSMLRFIKYSRSLGPFRYYSPPLPVRQSSYEERRLEALTIVYLELSLRCRRRCKPLKLISANSMWKHVQWLAAAWPVDLSC